ncbi:MAG TPA: helix-turn-helix domain-containing protein, partial [Candidatus Limnocylindrales bacterium]
VGGLTADVAHLRESLIEARQASYFARRRRGERLATYAEVGSHALLLALQDDGVVGAFRSAVLQALVDYDDRRGTELVRTLELFLESGGEYRSTARALHVHVNTLRLRLARIEALTGRSFSSVEDRVDFFIALRSRA